MSDTVYEPARKRLRGVVEEGPELRSKPVLICVGTEREKYYVHEHLLRTNSSFFDTALRKDWAENQDRVIEVPATSNEAFNVWIKWLYTGRIFLIQHRVATEINGTTTHKHTWSCWGLAYDMGDFLQDSDFKDAVIDGIIEKMILYNKYPFSLAQWIYTKSPITSAHRKLAVDTFVNCWPRSEWSQTMVHPAGFFADVVKTVGVTLEDGVRIQRPGDYFNLNDTCKYHAHGSEKLCYRKRPAFRF